MSLKKGTVYLINIKRTDLYKIGITRGKIDKRIKSLQTGSPKKLILIDFFHSDFFNKIEKILHRQLKPRKYQPEDFDELLGEWFELGQEDVKNFKNYCLKIEKNLKIIKENTTLNSIL